jgi:hypothetical protein
MSRILIEEPCEHDEMDAHVWFTEKKRLARDCPGGSRTVLNEPDYDAAESLFDEGEDLDWLASDRLAVDVLVRKIVAAALFGEKES